MNNHRFSKINYAQERINRRLLFEGVISNGETLESIGSWQGPGKFLVQTLPSRISS